MSIKRLKKAVAAGLAVLMTVGSFNVTGINVSAAGLPTTEGHDKYVDKEVFDVISAEDFGSKPLDAPLFDKSKGSQDVTDLQVPTLAYDDTSISLVWMKPEKYDDIADYNVYINGKLDGTARESYEKNAAWADAYMKAFYEYYATASDVPMVEIDIHSYRATDLTPDTEYTFKVVAVNDAGQEVGTAAELTQKTTKTPEVFNIEDFGAVAESGATGPVTYDDAVNAKVEKNTKAIQDAIDACTPGGKVVIPEGKTYVSGALWLKSDMTLEVNGTLWASPNSDHFEIGFLMYPFYTDTRGWGLINATSADEEHPLENIRITGNGTLYGNGWKYGAKDTIKGDGYTSNKGENTQSGDPKDTATWGVPRWVAGSNTKVFTYGIQAADSSKKWLKNLGKYTDEQIANLDKGVTTGISGDDLKNAYATRSSLLIMRNITNVYVGDITIENPSNHSVNILDSRNIATENVKVFSFDGNNADGLGFGCSQNVICWNNFTDTGDDNLGFGSSVGEAARDCDIQTNSEVWMFNNFVREGHGGLAAGSHTGNGIQDVLFEDTIMNHIDMAFRFKSAPTNGGFGANITMRDCAVADTQQAYVFTTSYSDPNSASSTEFAEIGEFYNFASYNCSFYKIDYNTIQVLADVDSVAKPYNPWHTHHNMYFQDINFGRVGANGGFKNKSGWESLIGAENMVFYNFKTVSYDSKAVSSKTDKAWNNLQYCKNIQFQGSTLDSVNVDKAKLEKLMSQINVPAGVEVKAEDITPVASSTDSLVDWTQQAAIDFLANADNTEGAVSWTGTQLQAAAGTAKANLPSAGNKIDTTDGYVDAGNGLFLTKANWENSKTYAGASSIVSDTKAIEFKTRPKKLCTDENIKDHTDANLTVGEEYPYKSNNTDAGVTDLDGVVPKQPITATANSPYTWVEYRATKAGTMKAFLYFPTNKGYFLVDSTGKSTKLVGENTGADTYEAVEFEVAADTTYYLYATGTGGQLFGFEFTPKTESTTPSETESTKPTESTTETTKPTETESTKPTETESTTETTKPTETESTKPTESESTTETTKPTESESTTETTKPTETESTKPTESESTTETTKPTETETPSETPSEIEPVVWDGDALQKAAGVAAAAKATFTAVEGGEGLFLSNAAWSTGSESFAESVGKVSGKYITGTRPTGNLKGPIPEDGCFLKFEAKQGGTVKVYMNLGVDKEVTATTGDTDTAKVFKNTTGNKFMIFDFAVEAGKTYYVNSAGSNARFFQVEFLSDGKEPAAPAFETRYFDLGISDGKVAEDWTGITVNPKGGSSLSNANYGYTAEKGYGIDSAKTANLQGREEATAANSKYPYIAENVYTDFALMSNAEFKLDVPNGAYDVSVIAGSIYANKMEFTVEKLEKFTHTAETAAPFTIYQFPKVAVEDGQLNIVFGDVDNRVCGIIVQASAEEEINLNNATQTSEGLKTNTTYGEAGIATFTVFDDMPVTVPDEPEPAIEHNGKTYQWYVQSSNGSTLDGLIPTGGAAFKITPEKDSKVTFVVKPAASADRVFHFVEESKTNTVDKIVEPDAGKQKQVLEFEMMAGNNYYFYAKGSKPMVYAMFFETLPAVSGPRTEDPDNPDVPGDWNVTDGHSVKLTWPAVANDTGVFYGVETYVGDQKVDVVDGIKETTTTIGRLSGGVEYTFKVYVSEEGDKGNSMNLTAWNRTYLGEAKIKTADDPETPVAAPTNKTVTLSSAFYRHAQASWTPDVNDARVRGYKIYINGATEPVKTIYNYEINGYNAEKAIGKQVGRLIPGQENTVKFAAFTDAGLEAAYDDAKITTLENYDYKAPVFEKGAKVTVEVTGEDVVLSWPAATDDTAVNGYRVYVDGKAIVPEGKSFNPVNGDVTTKETTYTVSGLDLSEDHTFTIQAGDTWWKAAQTMGTFDKLACYNWTVKGISVIRHADGSTEDPDPEVPGLEGSERVAGYNRYETAIESAKVYKGLKGVEKFDAIVIAGADDFPDALTGSTLAAAKEAPIILAGKDAAQTENTVAYVKENVKEGGTVYILGGTASVPESVDAALGGYTVERVAGYNRYETNLKIVDALNVSKGTDVFIASGKSFPDSISVSGVAGAKGMPIFLTATDMTEETIKAIEEIAPENIYLIGGTAAVSEGVEAKAKELCQNVKRIAGYNRYESSVAIAEEFGMKDATVAVIAYGKNFPDGLTGGILAAELNAPVILVENGSYELQAEFIKGSSIKGLYVLGGTGVISEEVVNALLGK